MKVLFATDDSKYSLDAQALIGSLPLPSPTELLVLSVVPFPHMVTPGLGRDGELRPAQPSPEDVRAAETAATKASHTLARAGVATEVLVRTGSPADVICSVAEERKVDLVVVGTHGRSAMGRFLLGSVSSQVLNHAAAPVLIARQFARPIGSVLVGVDGSEHAQRAVRYLSDFPLPPDAKVTLASVVYVPPPFSGAAAGYYETEELARALEATRRAAEADAERSLSAAADVLGKKFAVEKRLLVGPPARTLLEVAAGADLLVLGSRGVSTIERWITGSVSLHVSHHAKTSVLVVR